jgi:DNA-binding NarL/FixJ family response regulator
MSRLKPQTAPRHFRFLQTNDIDILITDIGLPDINGVDLAIRILAAQPNISVVFATGEQSLPAHAPVFGAAVEEALFWRRVESGG